MRIESTQSGDEVSLKTEGSWGSEGSYLADSASRVFETEMFVKFSLLYANTKV